VEDYYASGRLHTKVDSDCTIYEYFDEDSGGNNRARLIKETATGGNYKVYEDYYVNTGQVRYVKEYSVSDELLNITEYDIDGTVIIPYDYIDDKYAVKREDNGSIATFLIDETGEARINTFRDGSGNIFEIYNWDTNWELTGTEKHFQDGSIEIYTPVSREDPFLRLTEKKIPDPDFIKGVNLPWINYGYDLGKESSTDYWIGYSSDPGTLYEKFDARKNDYVRVFLFADLRSGMNFSGDGTPIGFTEKVLEDMRKLLDAAKMFNIKLMPVLFDYGIADGVTHEGLFEVGEHPELITDPVKKEALLSIFGDFFDEFAADPNIYAWDIINEPEYSQAVSIQDMQSFVTDFVQMIHSRSPAATVTVGSKNRQSLVDNWTNAGLDLYQYHYYDDFEGTLPLDYHVYNLGLDKPVIAGELDPALATHKLDTLNENGCSGGFFWEDGDGYIIDDPAYAEISDWFKGISITYDYYASGRKYTETYNDGTVKEFEDRAAYPDGNGKLIKETYNTGAYKNHSYYNGATIVEKIDFFLSGGILFMRENYDVSGGLVSTALYHDNGQLKEIRRTNGTWEKYDENGTFIQSGEKTGAIEVEYNASGNIERLIEGAYIEERQYVTAGGIIEYTLAVNDGSVKAIRGGLYSGIDMISKENSSAADSAVRVTYDGGISVSYIDGAISSLAAENGYINFYNGDDVQRQNSANGSLYYFEDNFLKEVATTDGVIYNFDKEISASGITISLTSAIINDIVYNFTGSILSTITDGTNSTTVTELLLRNNLEIESLKVDRGSGEETIPGGDMLFKRIETLFETINTDVPNIKFIYSPDRDIREILTSEYTHLEFQNELISKTTSTEGVEVEYEFITENDEITGLRMTESGAMRTFNKSGELLSIELIDGDDITAVTFTGGILEDMEQAGAALRDISLDAAGNIEGARLFTTRGEKFFFAGGSLRDFIDSQNCEYAVDKGGEIIELTKIDTGEVFDVTYSTDPGSNSELITFTSQTSGTKYVYDDEMLKSVIDPSGMEVDYEYYTDGRAKRVQISYGGKVSSSYNYDYADEETIITNEIGTSRHYGADNRLARIVTAYDETYLYAYEIDDAGDPITFINYTYKELSDGTLIEYHKGRIEKITKPDNSWIDNIEFDTVTQELFKFSMHTADGNNRNVIIRGNFVQFEMEDSTRLIFYDGKLVAFGNSQGIVPIYDLDELEDIIYIRDPADHSEVPLENIDIAASNWRHQTYEDSQAIRFVERDFSDNYWELNIDLRTGDPRYSEGEMYLDLRYDIPGLAWQAPIDMRGKEISFLIQLDESFEYDPLYPCKFQVFAKDKNWHTQYGAAVRVNSRSSWMEVSLMPTENTINMGYTDPDFDPSNISMIGLRIIQPENAPGGLNYLGKVLVEENILPDLFENVNYDPNPLDDLYYGLGIDRNLDTLTGGDPLEQETILENFVTSFGNGPSGLYQESLLNQINWHTETEDSALQAIESVYRDAATCDIVLTINLNTSSSTNSKGELYFDVRNDVPGLGWGEPMNLTSRPLSMLLKVPRGMIGAIDKPNGARLFVEDENGNTQYGTWINLKEANKLYQMDLTPTFGDIPMGYTDPGFDPSKIIRMGVNISTQPGSNTNFQGQARLKFLPASGTGDTDDIVNMPLWMDLRGIKEYLLDDDDNYIRVPGVTYLAEEYFSYVFNNGSGREPTANFASLAAPNTRWKYYGSGSWETDTYNKGMTSIGWDASTETLKGALNMNSSTRQGEIYL
ncbi:MAG: hypothetical protein KKB12_01475, partial [Candidatus Omnitrophica bacterium]|nr:hypothetical protein [Candidatus Omnitrophota bacterium]